MYNYWISDMAQLWIPKLNDKETNMFFQWIRQMADLEMVAFMLVIGMIGWFALVAGFIALSKLWDRLTESAVYRCERLRRENARLRKKLREGVHNNARS